MRTALLLIFATVSLGWHLTSSAQYGPPPVNFFEVSFESLPRDIVGNFHKKHPGQSGTKVLARAAGWKVTHYKIEFPSPDGSPTNAVLPVKDVERLTVEWEDRNKDGRVDLQRHFFQGMADADEVLVDEDYDGFFDSFTLFGAGILEKDIHIAVPRRVTGTEKAPDSAEK